MIWAELQKLIIKQIGSRTHIPMHKYSIIKYLHSKLI